MNNIQYNGESLQPMDAISEGWNVASSNYGLLLGISVVALLILMVVGCIPFVGFFIVGPMMTGVYYCFLKQMDNEPVEFGMMFYGFNKFVPTMVLGLISSIPGILSTILQWVFRLSTLMSDGPPRRSGDFYQAGAPSIDQILRNLPPIFWFFTIFIVVVGFIVGVSMYFVYQLQAEHELSIGETIRLSAIAAWSNIGWVIIFGILQGLIALAGLIALCIGIFFVLPILYASHAVAYRQLFPRIAPIIPNTPPPPTSYEGGIYGTAQ